MKNLFLFCLLLTIVSCTEVDNKIPITPDTDALSLGITKTGLDLFKDLSTDNNNLLISPLSIHTALSMTLQGADGVTLDDMKSTLYVSSLSKETIGESYNLLTEDLKSKNDSTILNTNNAIFYDPSRINIFKEFKNGLGGYFNTTEKDLDFNDQNTVKEINDWAANSTNQRIKKVIEDIKDNEILFIINALYFIGDWELGFSPQLTQKRDFHLSDGTVKEVDMMSSDEMRTYYNGESYKAIDIDFKGKEFAMTFVLPKENPTSFLTSKSQEELYNWYENLLSQDLTFGRVMTSLPKFEMSSNLLLNDVLKSLGMESAFENADLTKMGTSPLGRLFVSRVLHDTYIKVDEKGVEGAAVTTVGIGADSAPPFINFNKPFFFILRHKASKIPIFIGTLNTP